jgi:hypothetical protein
MWTSSPGGPAATEAEVCILSGRMTSRFPTFCNEIWGFSGGRNRRYILFKPKCSS